MTKPIILFYDGECSFCNKTVQWVIKRNPTASVYFASLQGETAQSLLYEQHQLNKSIDSLILYKNDRLYLYSDAALELVKEFNMFWKLLYVLKIIPTFIRNGVYKGFAKRRYKWFGTADVCQLPAPHIRKRFID